MTFVKELPNTATGKSKIHFESATLRDRAAVTQFVFRAYSELRALAEVNGSSDAEKKFVRDFVAPWNKVIILTGSTSPKP